MPALRDYEQKTFQEIEDFKEWLEGLCEHEDDRGLLRKNGSIHVFPFLRHDCLDCILELLTPPAELSIRDEGILQGRRLADASERRATAAERSADALEISNTR